jgi:hypothetical protein
MSYTDRKEDRYVARKKKGNDMGKMRSKRRAGTGDHAAEEGE